MCRVLQVSASGYYAWRQRPCRSQAGNEALTQQIRRIHQASRQTYGSPRVHAALQQAGVKCSGKRVAALMRQADLSGVTRRSRRPVTTQSRHDYPIAPNLLGRDFTASAPHQKWLADLSYIPTHQGFLYLASVEDIFSRKIVGWAMDTHMRTSLVERALHMALEHRRPPKGVLHHSDRGSQYASDHYQALLKHYGFRVSMNRPANCYDNAMKESFFATLKAECVPQPFPTWAGARSALFDYTVFAWKWSNSPQPRRALCCCHDDGLSNAASAGRLASGVWHATMNDCLKPWLDCISSPFPLSCSLGLFNFSLTVHNSL